VVFSPPSPSPSLPPPPKKKERGKGGRRGEGGGETRFNRSERVSTGSNGLIWTGSDGFQRGGGGRRGEACFNRSERVSTGSNGSGQIWTGSDGFQQVWTDCGVFQRVPPNRDTPRMFVDVSWFFSLKTIQKKRHRCWKSKWPIYWAMILMCPCTYNRFHLFFLIQSILLFHDRRFFQLVLYMYDYNDKNTVGKHLFFLIQSILLFHDRCCFTFFSARPIYVRLQWQKYSWKTFIFLIQSILFSINTRTICLPSIHIYI
jgi:hypothetical protein